MSAITTLPVGYSKRNRRVVLVLLVLTLTLAVCVAWLTLSSFSRKGSGFNEPVTHANALSDSPSVVLAAPGRVEGKSEATDIGTGADGILSAVLVEEGQKVVVGQLLATVDCANLEQEISAARAETESRQQARKRLIRGSRDEERARAAADSSAAQAELNQADLHFRRTKSLVEEGVVSRETFDQAKRDFEVSRAKLQSVQERERQVNAPPLAEEVALADAEVKVAQDRVATGVARLDKCRIKSPMAGTVLRVHKRSGESVSTIYPQPILTVADTSQLRVRAEVDERDIGRVRLNQRVVITSDASPDRPVEGKVVRLASQMGRKQVRSGDPAEKSDRDVLEVLVEFDRQDTHLVVGLRVTVQFLE
jgi:HlyD family secretion protein